MSQPNLITILQDGEPFTHMEATYGAYATVCGLDGDDPSVGQEPADTPRGAKIDCPDCRMIWETCRSFRANRFANPTRQA